MKFKNSTSITLLAVFFSCNVSALEPASIKTESGVDITPLLESKFEYDNNIFNSSSNEKSSTKLVVKPSVNFQMIDALNTFSMGTYVESGTYFSSSDDNYLDGGFEAATHLEPSSRDRFDFKYEYDFKTEQRGTGVSEGLLNLLDDPSEFREQNADLRYEFGGITSSRFALLANYQDIRFTNNRNLTQYRDFDERLLGGQFLYALSALTDLTLDASYTGVRYDLIDESGVTRDSNVKELLVGVRWEATALTTGVAKIGYQNKSFKAFERGDFNGVSWLVEAQWAPLSYSTFRFTSQAGAVDPDTFGDYIDQKGVSLGWEHTWSPSVSTSAIYSYTNDDFSGVEREDDSQELVLSVIHNTARWLETSMYYTYQDKDSNLALFKFDKSIVGINFKVSM